MSSASAVLPAGSVFPGDGTDDVVRGPNPGSGDWGTDCGSRLPICWSTAVVATCSNKWQLLWPSHLPCCVVAHSVTEHYQSTGATSPWHACWPSRHNLQQSHIRKMSSVWQAKLIHTCACASSFTQPCMSLKQSTRADTSAGSKSSMPSLCLQDCQMMIANTACAARCPCCTCKWKVEPLLS